tara:strand:- start:109 stop:273 length:165 start_codon:yes stop_codon:yes gene_type:complete
MGPIATIAAIAKNTIRQPNGLAPPDMSNTPTKKPLAYPKVEWTASHQMLNFRLA